MKNIYLLALPLLSIGSAIYAGDNLRYFVNDCRRSDWGDYADTFKIKTLECIEAIRLWNQLGNRSLEYSESHEYHSTKPSSELRQSMLYCTSEAKVNEKTYFDLRPDECRQTLQKWMELQNNK